MNFVSTLGDPIPNVGEHVLLSLTEEETLRTSAQKAIGSVQRVCDAGHTVVFHSDCSYVYNKHTGETNLMREDQDNDVLDMWVLPSKAVRGQLNSQVFMGSDETRPSPHKTPRNFAGWDLRREATGAHWWSKR